MSYVAPVAEQLFALETSADLAGLLGLPKYTATTIDDVSAILTEAGRFAADVFAPLNRIGDVEGAIWRDGAVTLPAGFSEAYSSYVEQGWNTLGADPAMGGQGLPFALSAAVMEMLQSANMAFALCPMLTLGSIEALQAHASPEQQETYLRKLVTGEWTGTMNLTEPQAGSDVGALRTRAEPTADGRYLITGQKIFISWGEHDCAENIVHLVLARLPDAPPGTRGISLFIVPKFHVDSDGAPGDRNDVLCSSIEHKLGIHASPTCSLSFGENGACYGELIGPPHSGMRAMFTMMNHARINVGLQGVAIAERAYQGALAFARDRVQSARFGGPRTPVPIVEHADVRRMLMTMKATTEAIRALAYCNAAAVDRAHAADDGDERARAARLADLLTPLTKAYATDMGVEMSSLAVQVFGGMGYVEETGAGQHLRDARIAPIYEGTNGIQALDLVGRKLLIDDGVHWRTAFAEIKHGIDALRATPGLEKAADRLAAGLHALDDATQWIMARQTASAPDDVAAGATPYLRMFAMVMAGHLLSQQAIVAGRRLESGGAPAEMLTAKLETARFFLVQMLPQVIALHAAATAGADSLHAFAEDRL